MPDSLAFIIYLKSFQDRNLLRSKFLLLRKGLFNLFRGADGYPRSTAAPERRFESATAGA